MKENYDVIVIGAGPGGSSTAGNLARKGFNVALFEKRQEIGSPKRCGEGLSVGSMKMIEDNFGSKIPQRCIAQTIDGSIVYAPNGKEVIVDFGEDAGAVMERKVFDKWLAMEAAKLGAYVQAKTYIKNLIIENGYVKGVKGEFEGDEFTAKAKVVVACDGVESKIARIAGLNTTNQLVNIDSGYQYEMANLKMRDKHKIELFFGHDIAERGYVWVFPKGDHIANVGVGVAMTDKTARYFLDKFIKEYPYTNVKDASIIEVNSGGIPVGGFLENMVSHGLVVVGDAAHQVNPIHGGGMKEATIAGKIAADVIEKGIKQDNVSQEVLSEYNKLWWAERGQALLRVQKLREVTEKLSDSDYNDLAEHLTGEDCIELARGNKMGTLAKLLMKNPKLLTLAKHLVQVIIWKTNAT